MRGPHQYTRADAERSSLNLNHIDGRQRQEKTIDGTRPDRGSGRPRCAGWTGGYKPMRRREPARHRKWRRPIIFCAIPAKSAESGPAMGFCAFFVRLPAPRGKLPRPPIWASHPERRKTSRKETRAAVRCPEGLRRAKSALFIRKAPFIARPGRQGHIARRSASVRWFEAGRFVLLSWLWGCQVWPCCPSHISRPFIGRLAWFSPPRLGPSPRCRPGSRLAGHPRRR